MKNYLNKTLSGLIYSYYHMPDHPMKLRLWWKLLSFIGSPRLQIPYANSSLIFTDTQDYVDWMIFSNGFYEPEVWNSLKNCIISQEIIWDIGAHIGSFSILATENPKVKKLYAFEPNPPTFNILQKNLTLNGNRFEICNFALSDKSGEEILFAADSSNTGGTSLLKNSSNNSCRVNCETIDSLVFQKGFMAPSLLKIDVEGWELQVLRGANQLLSTQPPKAIVFENDFTSDENFKNQDIYQYLKEFGYHIERIERPNGFIDQKENFLASRNLTAT